IKAQHPLAQLMDRLPSAEDNAENLDKPAGVVKKILKLNERVTSVDIHGGKDLDKTLVETSRYAECKSTDAKLQEDGIKKNFDKPLVETISDAESMSPTEKLQEDGIKKNIANWVFQLSEKQREVICRRYGLCGYENATLEQVAQELGVTRERVRQIQMDSLK